MDLLLLSFFTFLFYFLSVNMLLTALVVREIFTTNAWISAGLNYHVVSN